MPQLFISFATYNELGDTHSELAAWAKKYLNLGYLIAYKRVQNFEQRAINYQIICTFLLGVKHVIINTADDFLKGLLLDHFTKVE